MSRTFARLYAASILLILLASNVNAQMGHDPSHHDPGPQPGQMPMDHMQQMQDMLLKHSQEIAAIG